MKTTIIKYIIYAGLVITLIYFLRETKLTDDKVDSLINLVVSITSITVAILMTFFFSKIFAERQDRIQRKSTIDEYSKKITSLRRIAHRIKNNNKFWEFAAIAKRKLEEDHPNMTVEQFRSLEYDDYSRLTKELKGELAPQAYLSLRGLENQEKSDFEFFRSFKLENYSLDELIRFKEYCGFFWAFCDEYKKELSFNNSSSFDLNFIREDFLKIKGYHIDNDNILKEIMCLFSEFQERIFPEIYFLTEQNQRKLPIHFFWIAINLVVYLVVMIGSIFLFIQPICLQTRTLIIITFVSFLTVNTIDLAVGLFISIPKELKIHEFYKI